MVARECGGRASSNSQVQDTALRPPDVPFGHFAHTLLAPLGDRVGAIVVQMPPVALPESVQPARRIAVIGVDDEVAELFTEQDEQEIEGFGAEMVDRFGTLPEEVEHLLDGLVSLLSHASIEQRLALCNMAYLWTGKLPSLTPRRATVVKYLSIVYY